MRVLLIDGRSGSGKTTLASELAAHNPFATVLALDSVYPGWDGLEAANDTLVRGILRPLKAGRPARWRAWDWSRNRPGEWRIIPAAGLLIVEGAGSLSRASRRLADRALWLELDEQTRKRRALDRDGEAYAPHWDRWAAQESRFAAREGSRRLADAVLFERVTGSTSGSRLLPVPLPSSSSGFRSR